MVEGTCVQEEEDTYLQNLVRYDEDITKITSPFMGLASNVAPNEDSPPLKVIANRYEIQGEAFAAGAFGCVYIMQLIRMNRLHLNFMP